MSKRLGGHILPLLLPMGHFNTCARHVSRDAPARDVNCNERRSVVSTAVMPRPGKFVALLRV